jgi:putative ABC transport system permease protein
MEFGPIWRALLRNKGGAILIALQVAITMAIMVNAIAIMQERASNMGRPSGIDEANTLTLTSTSFAAEADRRATYINDLEMLRNTPGVVNAVGTNSFPLRGGGWSMGLQTEPGEDMSGIGTTIYFGDEHMIETFDVELIDGTNFAPEQVVFLDPDDFKWEPYVIITESLAKALFPDERGSVVGKTAYINQNDPVQIIGVIDQLQAPWQSWDDIENALFSPVKRAEGFSRYVVRAEPGMRDELLPKLEEMLASADKTRLIRGAQTFDEVREEAYLGDSAMIKILGFVIILLTAITGLGIVGLASFNVSRRTRQIGIRRTLGATKPAIMRYFMLENFIVSSIGVFVGGALAIALNIFMVENFDLTPMAWWVVPVAMVVLWLVGQAAVAGPARRATKIPPSIATRSG